MGNDHNHHSDEKKPVAFTAPLIFGLVITFVILAFASLGNPCHHHGDCSTKECEKTSHSSHNESADHSTEVKTTEKTSH